MQLNKHNSKTPPERKPKWLRKGIALLAAIATLATGGVVASTAYAGGGGGNQTASGSGTPSKGRNVWWTYKDWALSNPSDPTSGSFGSAAVDSSVNAAFAASGIGIDNEGPAKITAARTQAYNECVNGFHARHPGEGDGDCRVVAVGAMLATGSMVYYGTSFDNEKHADLGGKNQWQAAWDNFIKNTEYNYAGTQPYKVTDNFKDEPNLSVQKIMARDTYNDINKWNDPIVDVTNVNKSVVVIVLDKYQPAQPIQKFTPTISTSAPHVIQEGQSITDNVTVGVKQGDQWPKDEHGNVSITAKGYYFTGPKDVILKRF